MTLDQLYKAIDQLSQEERHRLKAYLNHTEPMSVGEKWMARFDAALDEFWSGVPKEKQAAILEAITIRSAPQLINARLLCFAFLTNRDLP